jgi:hypothetical protein
MRESVPLGSFKCFSHPVTSHQVRDGYPLAESQGDVHFIRKVVWLLRAYSIGIRTKELEFPRPRVGSILRKFCGPATEYSFVRDDM